MDRIHIAPRAQVGGDGDIGNSVLNLVIERGGRKVEGLAWRPIEARFKANQPFVDETRIGAGDDREDGERPVQFVKRRQPQPGVG